MVDQTNVIGNGHGHMHPPRSGMTGSVRSLLHDTIVLGELQCKLLLLDLREGRNGMIAPLVIIVLAVCLALGTFPIVLAALGLGLTAAGLPQWAAFLVSAFFGLVISCASAYVGWRWLKRELAIIKRSHAEFKNNVAWLKSALKQ